MGNGGSERAFLTRLHGIGVNPVVIAREPGELVDDFLAHSELVGPGAVLLGHQRLHGLDVLDGDLALGSDSLLHHGSLGHRVRLDDARMAAPHGR
jgi:hypothetical protein